MAPDECDRFCARMLPVPNSVDVLALGGPIGVQILFDSLSGPVRKPRPPARGAIHHRVIGRKLASLAAVHRGG